jgi:iron-sulfur cluster assembly protein
MLTLTDAAKDAVRDLVAGEGGPAGSGLRITAEPADEGEAELELAVVAEPEDGDQVIDEDGARLFLEREAASLLDDQVLDAQGHDDHFHFSIEPQADA